MPKDSTTELDTHALLLLLPHEHMRQWNTAEKLVNMLSRYRDVTVDAHDARYSMNYHNKGEIEVRRTGNTRFIALL